MSITGIFLDAYNKNLNGKQIDKILLCFLGKYLTEIFFQQIQLKDLEEFIRILEFSDDGFILVHGNDIIFCSVYLFNQKNPASRIYYYNVINLLEFAEIQEKINLRFKFELVPISINEFEKRLDKENFLSRKKEYDAFFKNKTSLFRGLVEGRQIKQTFDIISDICIICGQRTKVFVTTSIEKDVIFKIPMCKKHAKEAIDKGILEYLFLYFGYDAKKFNFYKLSDLEYYYECFKIVNEKLDCHSIITDYDNRVIKAIRKESGFELIFRIKSANNYAYVIINNLGAIVGRFDSSNHHPIKYGPDHLHFFETSRKPESSFCFGYLPLDIKIFTRELERLENL